jgi:hypothetical protein
MSEEDDALAMCADECAEVLGPQSCQATGRPCSLTIQQPPRRVREVRWSPEAVLSVRDLTGNDDWWPR